MVSVRLPVSAPVAGRVVCTSVAVSGPMGRVSRPSLSELAATRLEPEMVSAPAWAGLGVARLSLGTGLKASAEGVVEPSGW